MYAVSGNSSPEKHLEIIERTLAHSSRHIMIGELEGHPDLAIHAAEPGTKVTQQEKGWIVRVLRQALEQVEATP